jgi:hypothetical protein
MVLAAPQIPAILANQQRVTTQTVELSRCSSNAALDKADSDSQLISTALTAR